MAVLLGRTSAGTTSDFSSSGATAAWSFVASASGNLAVIKAQTKVANAGATAIQLGIYTDSAGNPNSKLASAAVDDLATARGTGVFQATISPTVSVSSGTTYWLAWYAASENFDFQGDSAGAYKEDLGTAMPATFTVEGTSSVNAIIWGEDSGAAATVRLLGSLGVGT